MESDYPAAHSMDATWFAVDAAGHVGVFDTGENGHVPEGVEGTDVLFELWRLRNPDRPEEDYWGGLPPEQETADQLGVFLYEYDDEGEGVVIDVVPYRRSAVPTNPLHVDQLSPALRKLCKTSRFAEIDFAKADLVQPMEQFRCILWAEEASVAYLCADGKTVRPIPGKEDKFATFRLEFTEMYPDEAAGLIFEGPDNSSKKPHRRRRKEKDDGE